ncbi:MAG: DUF3309 family protein [Chlamydiales bacterium]|nr:DUF3309 family protein [Chlamydiales bacterium]
MGLILLIIIIVLLLGAVPAWPYSRGWGYQPAAILAVLLLILLILALSGTVVIFPTTAGPVVPVG